MNYYITTSIPYVNGEPHIGFGMELVQADVLARSARAKGHTVLFSTGSDEHGGKIAEKATELGITPKEFTDKMSANFRDVAKALNVSNDRFIRTTDTGHEQRAGLIWKSLQKDIFKNTYVGWYCTGDEAFFTEAVVKENNGICPNHNRKYEKVEEENYFFRLSTYSDQIKKAIDEASFKIIPATRKHEILNVIKDGLEDISISRPKDKISWGVPVPGDETQVMYVWFEALMNYITVLGYPEHDDFKKFWPANVQVIGKDIIRFHAAIWPGMLLALGLPLPKLLYVHGFINAEGGQKMSKSLGNVVAPQQIIEEFGADAFRYFVLRHIPSYEDGEFSWDRLLAAYNGELANELGNAVQRTAAMITQYQNGIIGEIPEAEHDQAQYWQALEECHFDRALDEVWEQVRGLNQYIDEAKPWVINKDGDKEHLKEVLAYQVGCLLEIAEMLAPFMPETSQKIRHVFEEGVVRPSEGTLFSAQRSKAKDCLMDSAFLDNAQQVVMGVLHAAEAELMAAYGNVSYEAKADRTVVTELDKSLEVKLRNALRPLDTSLGILGEELGQEGSQTSYWLVDPIDGTESFIRGIPNCKNLLCLVQNGKPVWALSYYFTRNELWTARAGQGTYCNDKKITMMYRPMDRCWFELSGKIHAPDNAAILANLRPHIAGYAMMHDTSNVVSGKVDGIVSFESGGGPWDYAPRELLYQEAGAKIANIGSDSYDFHSGNYLVAHPKNFDALTSFIVEPEA